VFRTLTSWRTKEIAADNFRTRDNSVPAKRAVKRWEEQLESTRKAVFLLELAWMKREDKEHSETTSTCCEHDGFLLTTRAEGTAKWSPVGDLQEKF
jgi:hypothetical protein